MGHQEVGKTLDTFTGGTCNIGKCAETRRSICKNNKCICEEGDCAYAGGCIEKGSCPAGTGGTCGWIKCDVSRNAVCKNSKCVCDSGNCVWRGVHGEYARGIVRSRSAKRHRSPSLSSIITWTVLIRLSTSSETGLYDGSRVFANVLAISHFDRAIVWAD